MNNWSTRGGRGAPVILWLALSMTLAAGVLACSPGGPSRIAALAVQPAAAAESVVGPVVAAAEAAMPALALSGHAICIDPGHDATYTPGASAKSRGGGTLRHPVDGIPMHEHELTLSVATRLQALLEADGARVCLTRKAREEGGGLQITPSDFTGDGVVRHPIYDVPEIIQARIDYANDFEAEVLVSIHFNGSEDGRLRGTEVYYTDGGPRPLEGRELAQTVLDSLLAELTVAGHPAVDRGVRSDKYQRYSASDTARLLSNNAKAIRANGHDPAKCDDCYRLVGLGNNPMSARPGRFLAALVEVEFLSNPDVVDGFLMRPDSLDVIASGLHKGLRAYLVVD